MNSNPTPFKKRSNPLEEPTFKPAKSITSENDSNRDKYTATMSKDLRKRVKVASAMTGVQVSTFIEQACAEKLEREGY